MRIFGFTLVLLLLIIKISAQQPDPLFVEKIANREKSIFLKKTAFTESDSYANSDIVYQRMELEIDPNVLYIKGVIHSHFTSKIENLDQIEFDLHSVMQVDSVHHLGNSVEFERPENKIVIPLPQSLTEGQLDSVSVFYQGNPGKTGFGSFSKTTHDGVPNIWTLSEPYGAMDWWPCKQSLIDKIDSIDILVTSPEAYRTASLGLLVTEQVKDNKRTMHWKHRYPVATYLVAVSVTNYLNYSDTLFLEDGRHIEVQNYVYPEDEQYARGKTPVTIDMLELFNQLIDEYPFAKEKYGHAQFGWGGGMEHQTMSFMYNFGFELVAHELAHQWFGDYITTGSWQDIWLNEGFATYLAGLSYENLLEGFWWPRWKKLNVDRIVSKPDGSVFVSDTTDIGAIFSGRLSYSKGAYLLHMLRWIMGDELFFSGIKSYYTDPEIANGFARTHQLIKHMENAADTTFTEFFNDWFYGEGFPIYSAQYSTIEDSKLKIKLNQNSSHNSVAFFEMPVPVRAYNANKSDSADFRLIHMQNGQEFTVDPGFKVAEIKIDPDYWLVSQTGEIVNTPYFSESEELVVYPNPFDQKIRIHLPTGESFETLSIYNLNGDFIQSVSIEQTEYGLSGLSAGSYVIRVKTNKNIYQTKIVKPEN